MSRLSDDPIFEKQLERSARFYRYQGGSIRWENMRKAVKWETEQWKRA